MSLRSLRSSLVEGTRGFHPSCVLTQTFVSSMLKDYIRVYFSVEGFISVSSE